MITLTKLVRIPLILIPDDIPLPILFGPLRGRKWLPGSGRKAFWFGWYEALAQQELVRAIKLKTVLSGKAGVFYDVGANAGFFTLLSSLLCRHVVAFEPLPINLKYLRSHIALNHRSNVEVIAAAVSDSDGLGHFSAAEDLASRGIGKLADEGISIRTVTLDSLVDYSTIPPPDFIKMDIEGAEAKALRGAERCIRTHRPIIFLATHGLEIHEECLTLLGTWRYHVQILASHPEHRHDLLCRFLT